MMARKSGKRDLVQRELLATSEQLCSKNVQSRLGIALRDFLPTLKHAFILMCIPDQAEDFYWVLVSSTEIVKIEVPRGPSRNEEPVSLQMMDVVTFRQNRYSKDAMEKLEIALELF
jgi:hypothetical protein